MSDSFGPALRKMLDEMAGQRPTLKSYTRVGPVAQYRHLSRTRAGRAALGALGVTPRTVKAWTSGTRRPSKANAGRIAEIYETFAGLTPRVFPQQVRGMAIQYDGPSPWQSDNRHQRTLDIPAGVPHWERIQEAYEGDDYDDDDLWDDLAYEDVLDAEFGTTSPDSGVGGVTLSTR